MGGNNEKCFEENSKKKKSAKIVAGMPDAWEDAFKARFTGSSFGSDAIGLFALGLQFNIDDLEAVGAESVTGGNNDKKCDCSPSAPLRQIEGLHEGRISGSS